MNIYYYIRRLIKSRFNKKINIVFVCHRPKVWRSLESIFEACAQDKHFNVTIVAIPNKKQLEGGILDHEFYKTEGAEEYFKNFPCTVINGYNYISKTWISLKKIKPDYIFFQQPYNNTRYKYYKSKYVSKFSKIIYVHYAANIIGGDIFDATYPKDFIQDVDTIFTADDFDHRKLTNYIEKNKLKTKLIKTGFPRYDNLERYKNFKKTDPWSDISNDNSFRIIWTPRWCTNENNCHFFDYKDSFLNLITEKKREISFIFRPHPQAFSEWISTGELSNEEANSFISKINTESSKIDYSEDYLNTFYSSDVLVTDISSIIAEYFPTGKPIIYCHKTDCFNDFSRKLSEGFYWVKSWNELADTIQNLRNGYDPLKEKRKQLISEFFIQNTITTAGFRIKEEILNDFYR